MSDKVTDCACSNLRRSARLIAQFYDKRLQPTGLKNTQFTLLATLSGSGPVSMTRLAEKLATDRTTLARNVKLLERDGLVQVKPGKDARVRDVSLTDRGKHAFQNALPHWQAAQSSFLKEFGQERWTTLHGELVGLNETLGVE